MTTELLSVREICVSYGAVRALERVSVHVDEGEVVTVIGSNGAGKTTLMKTIAGLLESRCASLSNCMSAPRGEAVTGILDHPYLVAGAEPRVREQGTDVRLRRCRMGAIRSPRVASLCQNEYLCGSRHMAVRRAGVARSQLHFADRFATVHFPAAGRRRESAAAGL